ncbi:hypothetical protein UFOVP713_36 [uncultured Caudovirales phage]|uniref:Uncharacterized protein n=1 Tax=uncultured Caudovirales phage TaxID=2100421 RepID=A0A6J5NPK9_9CAUD|nr:hypothetical protein UFOVP713_36 [uncultured Caudovirales phage]
MRQQANDGVPIAFNADHYALGASGLLVQTDEHGGGNAENA